MVNMVKLGKFELTMDADFKVMRVNNSADSLDKSATSNDLVDISRIPVCIRKFLLVVTHFMYNIARKNQACQHPP